MVPGGLWGVTIPPDWLWMKGTEQPQYPHRAHTAAGTPPQGCFRGAGVVFFGSGCGTCGRVPCARGWTRLMCVPDAAALFCGPRCPHLRWHCGHWQSVGDFNVITCRSAQGISSFRPRFRTSGSRRHIFVGTGTGHMGLRSKSAHGVRALDCQYSLTVPLWMAQFGPVLIAWLRLQLRACRQAFQSLHLNAATGASDHALGSKSKSSATSAAHNIVRVKELHQCKQYSPHTAATCQCRQMCCRQLLHRTQYTRGWWARNVPATDASTAQGEVLNSPARTGIPQTCKTLGKCEDVT